MNRSDRQWKRTESCKAGRRHGKNYTTASIHMTVRCASGQLLSRQQLFQSSLTERLLRADGDAVNPPPKLRERNAVRRGGVPDLDLASGARCDRIHPTVLLQQTETDNRSLEQAVGRNVDAVTDTRRAGEGDGTRLRGHRRATIVLSWYLRHGWRVEPGRGSPARI